ncbi:hypothetical protein HG531_002350 [Fusarium graminearum]|nr:hypothetical protein HG531_002350 [Fusarium graminearum]
MCRAPFIVVLELLKLLLFGRKRLNPFVIGLRGSSRGGRSLLESIERLVEAVGLGGRGIIGSLGSSLLPGGRLGLSSSELRTILGSTSLGNTSGTALLLLESLALLLVLFTGSLGGLSLLAVLTLLLGLNRSLDLGGLLVLLLGLSVGHTKDGLTGGGGLKHIGDIASDSDCRLLSLLAGVSLGGEFGSLLSLCELSGELAVVNVFILFLDATRPSTGFWLGLRLLGGLLGL